MKKLEVRVEQAFPQKHHGVSKSYFAYIGFGCDEHMAFGGTEAEAIKNVIHNCEDNDIDMALIEGLQDSTKVERPERGGNMTIINGKPYEGLTEHICDYCGVFKAVKTFKTNWSVDGVLTKTEKHVCFACEDALKA